MCTGGLSGLNFFKQILFLKKNTVTTTGNEKNKLLKRIRSKTFIFFKKNYNRKIRDLRKFHIFATLTSILLAAT